MISYKRLWQEGSGRVKMARSNTILLSLVLLLIVGIAGACGPKTTLLPGQGSNEVWIVNGKIYPEKLIVPIGATVTWTNKDSKEHSVTCDIEAFNESLPPGSSFKYTFTEHKNYRYRCVTHPRMKGMVFVEPDLTANCDDCHA